MVKPYKYFSGTDDLNDPFKANKTDAPPNQTPNGTTADESKNDVKTEKDSDEGSEEMKNMSIDESENDKTESTNEVQDLAPESKGNAILTCVST